MDIGGLAQLPGSILVPTPQSTTTLSGLGTNGRILVAGDLVHTGLGELHAYPFLPDPQLGCATDPVHFTTLSLDVELVDPDHVVESGRFFEGRFNCALGDTDVTPADNTWRMRSEGDARVLSDQIPAGATCTVTERLDAPPAAFRAWAEPTLSPEFVVVAKRQNLGLTLTNRVRDLPPTPPSQPTTTDAHADRHAHADRVGPGAAGAAGDPVVVTDPVDDRRAHQPPGAAGLAVGSAHALAVELPDADHRRRGAERRRPAARRRRRPVDHHRAVHAPGRVRVGTDADAQPADAAGAGPASAEAAALVGRA